mmetsp:Transcript_51052/g.116074  ORF Transcript_51052/g.116074 Transcript_51052/m.116074 type:complete len:230 (+) Transcript_51052:356-1045(+)
MSDPLLPCFFAGGGLGRRRGLAAESGGLTLPPVPLPPPPPPPELGRVLDRLPRKLCRRRGEAGPPGPGRLWGAAEFLRWRRRGDRVRLSLGTRTFLSPAAFSGRFAWTRTCSANSTVAPAAVPKPPPEAVRASFSSSLPCPAFRDWVVLLFGEAKAPKKALAGEVGVLAGGGLARRSTQRSRSPARGLPTRPRHAAAASAALSAAISPPPPPPALALSIGVGTSVLPKP